MANVTESFHGQRLQSFLETVELLDEMAHSIDFTTADLERAVLNARWLFNDALNVEDNGEEEIPWQVAELHVRLDKYDS